MLFVVPVNKTEILIICGFNDEALQDVYEFNTETEGIASLGDSGLEP